MFGFKFSKVVLNEFNSLIGVNAASSSTFLIVLFFFVSISSKDLLITSFTNSFISGLRISADIFISCETDANGSFNALFAPIKFSSTSILLNTCISPLYLVTLPHLPVVSYAIPNILSGCDLYQLSPNKKLLFSASTDCVGSDIICSVSNSDMLLTILLLFFVING